MDDYLDEFGCEPDACATDRDIGRYDLEVINGNGYYNESGKFQWYHDPD